LNHKDTKDTKSPQRIFLSSVQPDFTEATRGCDFLRQIQKSLLVILAFWW